MHPLTSFLLLAKGLANRAANRAAQHHCSAQCLHTVTMASRGKGRRRREAMQLRASKGLLKRGKAGVSSKLPPPPNKADGAQLVPNSLRALMALRAGQPAPGKGRRRLQTQKELKADRKSSMKSATNLNSKEDAEPDASSAPRSRNKFAASNSLERQKQSDQPSSEAMADTLDNETSTAAATCQDVLVPSAPLTARQLAQRERVKAKRRKQKGRGKATPNAAEDVRVSDGSSSDEDAIARRVMTDRHKPAFGEQATAPLQALLKSKHWHEGANSRHQALFAKQMQQASMRLMPQQAAEHEALRSDVIEAYRKAKRKAANHPDKKQSATRASLKALVAEHEANAS